MFPGGRPAEPENIEKIDFSSIFYFFMFFNSPAQFPARPPAVRQEVDPLGFEPRAFRMQSGCDATTPCAP